MEKQEQPTAYSLMEQHLKQYSPLTQEVTGRLLLDNLSRQTQGGLVHKRVARVASMMATSTGRICFHGDVYWKLAAEATEKGLRYVDGTAQPTRDGLYSPLIAAPCLKPSNAECNGRHSHGIVTKETLTPSRAIGYLWELPPQSK